MNRSLQLFVTSLCLMGAVLTTTTVSAANLLTNGDFETGTLAPWAGVGGLGVNSTIIVQSPANGPALPGTHSAFLDNRAEANGLTMAQTTPNGTAVPAPSTTRSTSSSAPRRTAACSSWKSSRRTRWAR